MTPILSPSARFARARLLLAAVLASTALSAPVALAAPPAASPHAEAAAKAGGVLLPPQPHVWKNVQIVGGGFVDGVVFHPTVPGLRYARTDMGGAYRWDEVSARWQPILDWISYPDLNLMGVEALAVDPHNPDRVYLACGTYTAPGVPDGAILRSDDRGRTFERVNVPIKFGGNENGRGNGERLMVDPNDPDTLYLGTRHDGLWVSHDAARSWSRVASFPDISEAPGSGREAPTTGSWGRGGDGVVFIHFDPRSGGAGAGAGTGVGSSRVIYVGVSLMGRDNLYRSTDGGATWAPVPGQPTAYRPTRAAWAADGMFYIAYGTNPGPVAMVDGAVWRFDTNTGAWADITPDKPAPDQGKAFGYAAVSVDAHDPHVLIASSFGRYQFGGEEIFRSLDQGRTWKPVFANGGQYDASRAPYTRPVPIHWLFDIEIDPANPDHALFTTGYGGWETTDLSALDRGQPTHWRIMSQGIEETVGLALASPTKGVPLISGIGDYGGFVHADLDTPPPQGASAPPLFGNTTDVIAAPRAPGVVLRVGTPDERYGDGGFGYSLDGGVTWAKAAAAPVPGARDGVVGLSADGATWVWTPKGAAPFRSADHGASWTAIPGLPQGVRVVGDQHDARLFYALSLFDGRLWVSHDGARSFHERALTLPGGLPPAPATRNARGDERGGQDRLYADPDTAGGLWLAAYDGLYRSADRGATFAKLAGVEQILAFGFGKGTPGGPSALYLIGVVDGQRGFFGSDDSGRHWRRINDDEHQWGLVLQISGDPKTYGRVYVGTHGRGIFYGDLAPARQ